MKKISSPIDYDRLADQYLAAADTYPEGHPQKAVIMQEYEDMNARRKKAAT